MRHFTILVATLFLYSGMSGQNFISQTRKLFATFGTKTTKVVIPSTTLADLTLRDAVSRLWRISPYEFCSFEEYEKIRQDTSFFFLLRVDGMYKKELEPKIEYLTLVKGGPEQKNGLYSSHNIINLPLQQSDDLSGENLSLIPAYVSIIQDHIYGIQQDITLAFKGTQSYSDKIPEAKGRKILFAKEQIGYNLSEEELKTLFKGSASYVSLDEIDDALSKNTPESVVAVVIKPKGETKGSFCYKMVISADNYKLLFFRRHKIGKSTPAGFTKEDIRKISVPFLF